MMQTAIQTAPDVPLSWPEHIRRAVLEACASGTLGKIRCALRSLDELSDEQRGRPFKLGIARTFTIEAQADAIKLLLSTCPARVEIDIADIDNIEQSLLNPESSLLQPPSDAVLVLWRLEELHPRLWTESSGWSAAARAAAASEVIERIRNLVSSYTRLSEAPLFLSTLPLIPPNVGRLYDLHEREGISSSIFRINLEILNLAAEFNQVRIFDYCGWAAMVGEQAFDHKMSLYARQPIAATSLISFAVALRRTLKPLLLPPAKVLAMDLDNTLWGGVLGEDGLEGIRIGHEYPGNVYRKIQQTALSLKNRGTLLVLLSKNNPGDVEQAFKALPDMVLKLSDFAAIRVNWQRKCENLRDVADELHLGLDSFVFVDEQAFEREEMAYFIPEVRVLRVSEDPLVIWQALAETDLFDAYHLSREDRDRSEDYLRQKKRYELSQSSESPEDFLRSLDLKAVIEPVSELNLPRVVQMLAKTNQFNVTTRRHSAAEVRRIIRSERAVSLTLALRDRFGDQGIVGLALAVADQSDRDNIRLDSFLLSCRAIGRGAELTLWSELLFRASALGYRSITAEYIRTEKNSQVAELFDRLGMELVATSHEHRQYKLQLPTSIEAPEWIVVLETVNHG